MKKFILLILCSLFYCSVFAEDVNKKLYTQVLYFLDANTVIYLQTYDEHSLHILDHDTDTIWVDNSPQKGIYVRNIHDFRFHSIKIKSKYEKVWINNHEIKESSVVLYDNGKIEIGNSIPYINPHVPTFVY